MRILVINPIMYTSETKHIKRASSIQDTMMYDLCLAFHAQGHKVTLFAAEPYRPDQEEAYPFPVIWGKCVLPSVFAPHRLPVMPELCRYIRENREEGTEFIFMTEPQLWVNLRNIKGWEKVNLSLGTEVELSCNFVDKGFYAMPTVAAKWTF